MEALLLDEVLRPAATAHMGRVALGTQAGAPKVHPLNLSSTGKSVGVGPGFRRADRLSWRRPSTARTAWALARVSDGPTG